SYAPNAFFRWGSELPHGGIYVTAVDPNTTVKVMLGEVARLQNEPAPAKELAGAKSVFLTGLLTNSETTDGQASLLATSQVDAGDWRFARRLPERVRAVSASDVQAFARKHIHNLQAAVVGDPEKLDRALMTSQ